MILAIDQGTTGTTCIVFDEEGRPCGRAYSEFEQHFPRPGWVEHDAAEIWDVTRAVAAKALADAGVDGADLAGIGITNQRETVVAWDPDTGEPLHHALVWQDRRTAARCDELKAEGREPLFRERTGLVLDPYFSGHEDRVAAEGGRSRPRTRPSARSTPGSLRKLTGRHVTDYTNASRTLLFDIRKLAWDPELCDVLGVSPDSLPEPLPSAHVYGETTEFGGSVPVAGIAGDQQAALYGQACHTPGLGKNTYGTGSFVLENAGESAPDAARGPADHGRVGGRGPRRLRARGGDLRHRRRGPVAARRARHHRGRGRDRGARPLARLERRRVLRPGADRARLAALGSLLAGLRYLGHSFNPVSFYYCFDSGGRAGRSCRGRCRNIPWGERHAYVLARGAREGPVLSDELDKALHVSPLMGMEQTYAFRASEPGRAARGPHRVAPAAAGGGEVLRRDPLPAPPRARAGRCWRGLLARYPALSLQVVAKIYAQSLRLKLKGARYFPHPEGSRPKGFVSP